MDAARYIVTIGGKGYLVTGPAQAAELFGQYESITPEQPESDVPEKITRAQGKAALVQAGLWPQVEVFVAGLPDEPRAMAEIALNDTLEWERRSPFLNECGAALGIEPEQMDALFRLAKTFVF